MRSLSVVSALALALAWGCGDEVKNVATSAGGGPGGGAAGPDGGGGIGGAGGAAPGGGGSGGDGGSHPFECAPIDGQAYVVSRLLLGDTDFNGSPTPTAWQSFGFDIDGMTTSPMDLSMHCQPFAGASPNALADAPDGKDNSFGRNIIPIFLGLMPDLSAQVNGAITSGTASSLILELQSLTAAADQTLSARLFEAAPLLTPPGLDGSDCWPVAWESLNSPPDLDSAKAVFPSSTLTANLWESGATIDATLRLGIPGFAVFELPIANASLSVQLSADHMSGMMGQLGGVIETEALAESMRQLAGAFDPSLCMGTTIESLLDQIRQASDIGSDGTHDPNATCDALSIGIGFELSPIMFGAVAMEAPPTPMPCP